jgi:hypothetical protein
VTAAQLEQFLNDLATKLTPAGQQVFDMSVRNQFTTAAIGAVVGLVLLLIGLVFLWKGGRWVTTSREPGYWDDPENEGDIMGHLCFIVLGSILLVAGAVTFTSALPVLLDPQWYGLKDILNQFPGK